MTIPEWVQDAVFYQIFPDRFANGDPSNDPPNTQPWGGTPTTWGFQGGDFQGIIQHFDYLLDLGITAIYLNPIFQATSNHRYNTTDYFKIDPKLGTMEDFRAFIQLAHKHNIRVILDGVFNHCGRGFFAFNDILENQEHSPYLNWFHVKSFPVEAYLLGDARDYLGWWNMKSLPKFNTDYPQVRHYLLQVARYWIDQDIDGWRLDVPNEIDDDSFWDAFRKTVRQGNPEAYLLGEIWNMDQRWVGESHFDGLMNYPFRDAVLRLLQTGTMDIPQYMEKLETLLQYYPHANTQAMYMTLGSHDTERLRTKLENDMDKVRLAFLLLFTYPGAPAIYYGDEIGMEGGKDPGCRGGFPWNQHLWDDNLRNWVKQLIWLRKEQVALRRGDFKRLCADASSGCCAYVRAYQDQQILVLVNASPEWRTLQVPVGHLGWQDGSIRHSLLYNHEYVCQQGILTLSLLPWSGEILT
jgi:cyclomaltodextrinase / maltogenic alpha-amylase / neopullulanase